MTPEETALLQRREAELIEFHNELMPVLVEFIDRLGIKSPHEVSLHADRYAPQLGKILENMEVNSEVNRAWLTARMIYFVGEYFVQKYKGHWFVYDIPNDPTFGRYVVGQFRQAANPAMIVDPSEVALNYVDTPPPRNLVKKLTDLDAILMRSAHS